MPQKTYPIIWAGSFYYEGVHDGYPSVQILLPPGEATEHTQVESVIETMSITFSEIAEEGCLDIVHDMLSKWEQYASEQGYAFDYDAELYEKIDNRWCFLDDECTTDKQ